MFTNTPAPDIQKQISALKMPCALAMANERSQKKFFDFQFRAMCCKTLGIPSLHLRWDLRTYTTEEQECLITAINERYNLTLNTTAIEILLSLDSLSNFVFQKTPEYQQTHTVPTS